MDLILKVLGGFILGYSHYFIITDVLNRNYKIISLKNISFLILYSILMILNYVLVYGAFRLLTGLLIIMLIFKLLYNEKTYKTFSLAIICYVLTAVSEIVFTIFLLSILKINPEVFMNQMTGNFLSNIFVAIICILIYIFNRETIRKTAAWFYLKKDKILIIVTLLTMFLIGTLFFKAYNNGWKLETSLYLNSIAILIFCVLVFLIFKEKASSNKVCEDYKNLFEYVKTGEKLIREYHEVHHEHLNQLSIINDLEGSKKTDYINKIIKCDSSKESSWISELKNVPPEGLKGLLYYKISIMKNNQINVNLNIEDCFPKTIKNMDLYYDIYQIIGIYLDNALEATIDFECKEIGIEMYKRNTQIHIIIINPCSKDIDLNQINTKSYTTKLNHKGIGLYLVEKIIKRNPKINTLTKIENGCFVQEIVIKK